MKNAAIFTSQSYPKVSLKLSLFYNVTPLGVSWSLCVLGSDCWEISNSNWPIFHLNNTNSFTLNLIIHWGHPPAKNVQPQMMMPGFLPGHLPGLASAFCKFKCFLFCDALNFRSFCSQNGRSTHVETTDLPSPLYLFSLALILRLLFWICNSKISSGGEFPRLEENINVYVCLCS